MIIEPKVLSRVWGLHPETIIHVGAHNAEELELYAKANWGSKGTVWFEALPHKETILRSLLGSHPNQSLHMACLWSDEGVSLDFGVANNGQSSSALPLGTHAKMYPDIKYVQTLKLQSQTGDAYHCFHDYKHIGLLNLDVQGAELQVLKGFVSTLDRVDAIYSEVNIQPLYQGGALLDELDRWLEQAGFVLCDWSTGRAGWGDALWMRRELAPSYKSFRRFWRRIQTFPIRLKKLLRSRALDSPPGRFVYKHLRT